MSDNIDAHQRKEKGRIRGQKIPCSNTAFASGPKEKDKTPPIPPIFHSAGLSLETQYLSEDWPLRWVGFGGEITLSLFFRPFAHIAARVSQDRERRKMGTRRRRIMSQGGEWVVEVGGEKKEGGDTYMLGEIHR